MSVPLTPESVVFVWITRAVLAVIGALVAGVVKVVWNLSLTVSSSTTRLDLIEKRQEYDSSTHDTVVRMDTDLKHVRNSNHEILKAINGLTARIDKQQQDDRKVMAAMSSRIDLLQEKVANA